MLNWRCVPVAAVQVSTLRSFRHVLNEPQGEREAATREGLFPARRGEAMTLQRMAKAPALYTITEPTRQRNGLNGLLPAASSKNEFQNAGSAGLPRVMVVPRFRGWLWKSIQ